HQTVKTAPGLPSSNGGTASERPSSNGDTAVVPPFGNQHRSRGALMLTQAERGQVFRALHERDGAFIIPNPWDVGTARLLAHLGFEALATTSMGYAFSVGQRDNTVDRHRMMEHVSAIASATDLPVSADLENGFGDAPETVAETIRLAAAA